MREAEARDSVYPPRWNSSFCIHCPGAQPAVRRGWGLGSDPGSGPVRLGGPLSSSGLTDPSDQPPGRGLLGGTPLPSAPRHQLQRGAALSRLSEAGSRGSEFPGAVTSLGSSAGRAPPPTSQPPSGACASGCGLRGTRRARGLGEQWVGDAGPSLGPRQGALEPEGPGVPRPALAVEKVPAGKACPWPAGTCPLSGFRLGQPLALGSAKGHLRGVTP